MGDPISPLNHSQGPIEFPTGNFKGNYYSNDLSEMKQSLMEECRYLIIDPNQLQGMCESFHGFLDVADEYFRHAFKTLEPLISEYCQKKNRDPAFKLSPLDKNKIQEAAEQLNNIRISLSPEDFSQSIHKTLISIMHQIEKEPKTPQLLARLTGIVSSLCNLQCFSSDQAMNDLFFDLSSYTMGEVSVVSEKQITQQIKAILDAL